MAQSQYDLILVDGSSYLFRAFHAMPPLTNSEGLPTGAIKGVVNMLRSLQKDYPQTPVAVIFDTKGPTFRHEMYADYKANRPPMPDKLRVQIEPLHELIEEMGLPLIAIPGVEADDVIGTYCRQAASKELRVLVSTGDKDLAQLVNEQVHLLNTMTGELLDPAGVQEKYGFGPEHIIDYLALMGDKSDNIPGVPGVGEKSAKALIQGLGGVDALYSKAEQIAALGFRGSKTMAAKLTEYEAQLRLSYELATIRCDLPLETSVDALQPKEADLDRLRTLFEKFGFRQWVKDLGASTNVAIESQQTAAAVPTGSSEVQAVVSHEPPASYDYQLISETVDLQTWLADCQQQLVVCLVVDPGHYRRSQIAGLALAKSPSEAAYYPLQGKPDELDILRPYFNDYNLRKVSHDMRAVQHWLNLQQLEFSRCQDDVWLMAHVLDSSLSKHADLARGLDVFSIENLSLHYLNQKVTSIVDVLGAFGARQEHFSDLNPDEISEYACSRASSCWQLDAVFQQMFAQKPSLKHVYQHIEAPLVEVICAMESTGIRVDIDRLNQLTSEFKSDMEQLKSDAAVLAGRAFNLGSPKQLAEVLYDDLQLKVIKKTPSGAPSTNEEVLQQLAEEHELPAKILEYRHLNKLVGTYTEPLCEQAEAESQRVHTHYNQVGAATGRLSSTDPNLQNIPIRTEAGKKIRQAFVARPGYRLIAADYSQIELRIMAHLSQDEQLLRAFREGEDIHRATAAQVLGIEPEEVSDDQRRAAKAVNFGLIYGMGAFGLAKTLGISRKEAASWVEQYFERYPGVKTYMDETRAQAIEDGAVKTLFGRSLPLPDLKSSRQMVRAGAERAAINAPMQGSAADIIKRAMIDVYQWLNASHFDAKLLLQVHDELILEVAEADLASVQEGLRLRMQSVAQLTVPLLVDVGVGSNWQQAH